MWSVPGLGWSPGGGHGNSLLYIAWRILWKGELASIKINAQELRIKLLSLLGDGNGNPLQYSCLENPMGRGAWCPGGRKELDTTERLHFTHDGGGNEGNGDLLQKIPCMYCYTQCPQPTPPLETPGHSQASLDQFLVDLLLSPGSWCTRFCLCPPVSHIRAFKNMEIT